MSKGVNILSEAIALSAIENIAKYLPRAVRDGGHGRYPVTSGRMAFGTAAQQEAAIDFYRRCVPYWRYPRRCAAMGSS